MRPVTVLLTVVSVVVAGLLATYRDSPLTNPVVRARVGEAVTLLAGQQLTVVSVELAQAAHLPSAMGMQVTNELLVAVQLRLATPHRREMTGLACRLRRPGQFTGAQDGSGRPVGGETKPANGTVIFPESGLMRTSWTVFVTGTDDLAGAHLVCTMISVVYFIAPEAVVDLGLTDETLPGLVTKAKYRALDLPDATEVPLK